MKCALVSLVTIEDEKEVAKEKVNKERINIVSDSDKKIAKEKVNTVIDILNILTDNDLVLFSGGTLSNKSELDEVIKKNNNNRTTFVLEVGSGYSNKDNPNSEEGFYVVKKGKIIKRAIKQIFTNSSVSKKEIRKLLDELNEKRYFKIDNKNIRLIVCGEHNILISKKDKDYKAQFRFDDDTLDTQFQSIVKDTNIFLNPAHTPMGWQAILQKKLTYLSQNSRVCLFTTNESIKPGTKTHNLHKRSLQYIFCKGKEKLETGEIKDKYKITTIEID